MNSHLPALNTKIASFNLLALMLALALALTLALHSGDAHAAKRKSKAACREDVQMSKADELRCHATKTRYIKSGSEETRAERERRLKRECKGRPNAGMCLGFAS